VAESGHHSRNGFLTRKGIRVAQQFSLEGLTPNERSATIDTVGSVSGLRRDEAFLVLDDEQLDQQYRRFLNGS